MVRYQLRNYEGSIRRIIGGKVAPYFPKVGRLYGGGTVILADEITGVVTVVPTGYADDVTVSDWDTSNTFCSTYEKNGYDDYVMISPTEILALMGSADLRTKTGTLIGSDYWTNEINLAETDAKAWIGDSAAIEEMAVSNLYLPIPVRRVTVV